MRLPLASVPDIPEAARLVIGPDDVRDVGEGNERYDAVAPSGSGVDTEVDGGHFKSSSGHKVSSLAERPQGPSESPSLT